MVKKKSDSKKNSKNSCNLKNKKHKPHERRTFGQKVSDNLTRVAGSWGFIIWFLILIVVWIIINIILLTKITGQGAWDPYPFILLNLGLSLLAAIQAPVILMSQNRTTERDRKKAEADLAVDRKAEREIELIQKELSSIKKILKKKINSKQ